MKTRSFFLWIILTHLSFSSLLIAYEDSTKKEKKVYNLYELGASLGSPSKLNIVLGYWEDYLLLRVSGMYLGKDRGVQMDFGWPFDKNGSYKQYLSASIFRYQLSSNLGISSSDTLGVGAQYGLNWKGLTFQAGPAVGWDQSPADRGASFGVLLQLGYSFLLTRPVID